MTKFNIRGGIGDITAPNTKVSPQDNLYLAVNSSWLKKTKIPADQPYIGGFTEIDINVKQQLRKDFTDFINDKKTLPKIANFNKVVSLYKQAVDMKTRNNIGAKPLKADLHRLLELHSLTDLNAQAVQLFKQDFRLPIVFEVDQDLKDTDKNALYFEAPKLILPDASSYQNKDNAERLLNVFTQQMKHVLQLIGFNKKDSEIHVDQAVAFDQELAPLVKSQEENNDFTAMYNPYSFKDFVSQFREFEMKSFLGQIFAEQEVDRVIVTEPRFFKYINEIINSTHFAKLKSWMIVKYAYSYANYLSQELREANFPYSQAVYGIQELSSIAKQAYEITANELGEIVGVYYGKNYFGDEAKKDVEQMTYHMISVYNERLENNDWLTETTKKEAIKKLNALKVKIGYPTKLSEVYDQINLGDSLYDSICKIRQAKKLFNITKLNQKVDRQLWGEDMPAMIINAGYAPNNNDITFPAAIFQAPFYSSKNTSSENYGGIGAVIAHEISHAFDPNGSKFDEKGNIRNWWSKEDFEKFNELAQAEVKLFDGIQIGATKVNGHQTVGENVADLGGLTAAVKACVEEKGNLTELFENWARIWRRKMGPEIRQTLAELDPHAPGEMRANIAAQCLDEFYEAFNVTENDGMWLDPKQRVKIW